jgi:serine/threonine protein kinase
MNYSDRWRIIGDLGEGGQGKVYRVCKLEPKLEEACVKTLMAITGISSMEERRKQLHDFIRPLSELLKLEDPAHQGALKVLHEAKDARDANLASDRIKREIEVMSENLHPNLIEILEVAPDSTWYVSKFYQRGTLAEKRGMFKGNFRKALKAIRPLVEAVGTLHKKGYVHRDIKPKNIFVDSNNQPILGDFGLIYFEDDQRTRISATYENVGSRDWMPGWAMGIRIDEVKPTFDVFSLGKLLWSMVSGKRILRLWYFKNDEFNVEKLFPDSRTIKFANPLFEKCIVEHEKDCIRDANILLSEIDDILEKIDGGVQQIQSVKKTKRIEDITETSSTRETQQIQIPELSSEAKELLIEASKDSDGQVLKVRVMGGMIIQTHGKQFVERGNPRSEAAWEAAVDKLCVYGLLQERGYKGEVFAITNEGYRVADMLASQL